MLDSIRKGQRWITLVLVVIVGGVFVLFMGLGGPLSGNGGPSGGNVVELDELSFDQVDFQRQRDLAAANFAERAGDQLNTPSMQAFLDTQALRGLVERALLVHGAQEMGLTVSKEEIQRTVLSYAAFRDEKGQFDRERFVQSIEYDYGSQRNFKQVVRYDLLSRKLLSLVYAQARVSDGQARSAALYELEKVRLAYVGLRIDELPAGIETSEEQLNRYLEDHRSELEAIYVEDPEQYNISDQAKARHILIRVARDADEDSLAEARSSLATARERIEAGEEFAVVAIELSQDPGTRSEGGDLGLFDRNSINPAIDAWVFEAEVGQLSDEIRSDAGLHLVLLEERIEASERSSEEVLRDLAMAGATSMAAEERANAIAEKLAEAIRGGASLEDAARAEELTLERTGFLNRRPDGNIPGLGAAPDLLATAFTLDPEGGNASSDQTFYVEDKIVLMQVLEQNHPDELSIEETAISLQERLLESKRSQLMQAWLSSQQQSLAAADRLRVDASIVTN